MNDKTHTLFPDMTEAGVYDALYRDDAPLRPTIEALRAGCALANGPMERIARGSVFLYAIGEDRVLKVYPPPDEEEARAEEVVQKAVHAAELGLEVPRVLAAGEERGWRWLLMERLSGTPARDVWDTLSREELAGISATLGEWMRRFHNDEGVQALRLGESREGWAEALAELSSGVVAKHRRREASERWLERLGPYMASWSPEDETRLIHADLHPGNLMLGRDGEGAWALTGVLDFADTLRAPVGYDLGAPLVHLAQSRMFRLWPEREGDMLAIARMLLDHGADVNRGAPAAQGSDHTLSPLYFAIGHADNMVLAEWLLDRKSVV